VPEPLPVPELEGLTAGLAAGLAAAAVPLGDLGEEAALATAGSGFFVSSFGLSGLSTGLSAGLEAGFSSDEEEEDPAAPLHFFNASIHFFRSSEVAVAKTLC